MRTAILWIAAASCAALAQAPPKVIDVHMHHSADPGFLPKLVQKLDAVDGIAFLLVRPKDFPAARPLIEKHKNRLIGFGDIDLDDPKAVEWVDRFHDAGFRGLGEISSQLASYDDKRYWPIYARAEQHRMIALFHTGIKNRPRPEVPEDVSVDRMRATTLDLICRRFPKLTVIGAHLGNPDYAWAAEISRWHPNLYFDLSGSTLIKMRNDYPQFLKFFWWSSVVSPHTPKSNVHAFEKIVFASDVFGGELEEFDRSLERYQKMLDECGIPPGKQANIMSGTMWRLLQGK
jgi:uncharacterized protein